MKCTKCGAKLPEDVNFCMNCGTPVSMELLYVRFIHNQSGVDIYSNDKKVVYDLYNLVKTKIKEKHLNKLSEIKDSVNLFTFQYSKKFMSLGDDSINRILGCSRDFLIENGWEYQKKQKGVDTSKYKLVFSKMKEQEV